MLSPYFFGSIYADRSAENVFNAAVFDIHTGLSHEPAFPIGHIPVILQSKAIGFVSIPVVLREQSFDFRHINRLGKHIEIYLPGI
jgi:hypothetical protein